MGFGEFSADTLALFNSQGLSRFVPGLPFRPRQWEGFQYLGLGVLGLLGFGLVLSFARPLSTLRGIKAQWPLLVSTLAMLVYSWSSIVTYKGEQAFDLSALYTHLSPVPAILRSSGRLGWPFHMVLISAAVASVARLQRSRVLARVLLLLALVVEGAEHDRNRLNFAPTPLRPLTHAVWDTLGRDYAHLALVPAQIQWDCPYDEGLVNTLSYEAYRQNLTFNSGNFMGKGPNTSLLCRPGVHRLDARTVYVVLPSEVGALRGQGATCGILDWLHLCVAGGRSTALSRVLLRSASSR